VSVDEGVCIVAEGVVVAVRYALPVGVGDGGCVGDAVGDGVVDDDGDDEGVLVIDRVAHCDIVGLGEAVLLGLGLCDAVLLGLGLGDAEISSGPTRPFKFKRRRMTRLPASATTRSPPSVSAISAGALKAARVPSPFTYPGTPVPAYVRTLPSVSEIRRTRAAPSSATKSALPERARPHGW
jgi:hypothetical protein